MNIRTILAASAADPSELQQLRDEMKQLRADYDARLHALEARLQSAEAAAASEPAPTPPPPPPVATATGNAFNPKVSLILDGSSEESLESGKRECRPGTLGARTTPAPMPALSVLLHRS